MDLFPGIPMVAVSSYVIGAIPSSYIVGRLVKGIDLRQHGSGNLGAANTFRVLGTRAAVPVLLFDIAKGFIAVRYFPLLAGESIAYALVATFAVVLGHSYSVFVGFSGGKGVGTTSGAFLALAPYAVTICMLIWLVILLSVRIVSVASMIAALLLPISIVLLNTLLGERMHYSVLILSIAVAVLVIYKHRSNIRRLREGTEKRIF